MKNINTISKHKLSTNDIEEKDAQTSTQRNQIIRQPITLTTAKANTRNTYFKSGHTINTYQQ